MSSACNVNKKKSADVDFNLLGWFLNICATTTYCLTRDVIVIYKNSLLDCSPLLDHCGFIVAKMLDPKDKLLV